MLNLRPPLFNVSRDSIADANKADSLLRDPKFAGKKDSLSSPPYSAVQDTYTANTSRKRTEPTMNQTTYDDEWIPASNQEHEAQLQAERDAVRAGDSKTKKRKTQYGKI